MCQRQPPSPPDGGYIEYRSAHIPQDKTVRPYVSILRNHGPFLFGTTDLPERETDGPDRLAPVVILRLPNMTAIDAAGLHALEGLAGRLRKSGRTLFIRGARQQPREFLDQSDFRTRPGEENICPHAQAALVRAGEVFAAYVGVGVRTARNLDHGPW